MPDWVEHAIWWHVYPLGFVGAPRTMPASGGTAHRLGHLTNWLDYAVDLGVSGIALGPVFASRSHGYDTLDYFRIDRRLGDEDDFADFVAAAHRRGLRVLLDGVFNHVGRGFPPYQVALALGPDASEAQWFHLSWPSDGSRPTHDSFEGHADLVALNHDNPAVADHVVEVMCHWLRAGADGWRLDAAYAVPAAFWAAVLPRVRAAHPDAYIVGEVIHGDYTAFVRDSTVDAVTQYELWKATWSSLNDANFFELAHALGRHNGYLDSFVPWTFVGNHDVTRLVSQLGDERHVAHALVVLLTTGGTPAVYYGDEQAMRGVKEERFGGDDAIRPAFPDAPTSLSHEGWDTYHLHQALIGLRRKHSWLHGARTNVVALTNTTLVYEATAEDERLVVALSCAETPIELDVAHMVHLLAGNAHLHDPGPRARVELPPHGWGVLA